MSDPIAGKSVFYRPELDVVRFVAFLAVYLHHTIPRTGPNQLLNRFADAMGFGLCLFFVLSAYLITLLLIQERQTTGTIHLKAFYIRRVLRVWPLYLLGLTIGIARASLHGELHDQGRWFVAALLLSGNLVYPGTILMSHLWSISIEEQFYAFFPTASQWIGGRRAMLSVAVVLIILANSRLIYFAHSHASLDVRVWFDSFVQFEMFAAGILLALFDQHLSQRTMPASLLCITLSLGLWVLSAAAFHLKTIGATAIAATPLCAGYALVALACCLFIAAVQGLPAPSPLVYAGRISYGLYVFHLPVIALVTSHVRGVSGYMLSLLISGGIAALSYQYYEKPFLRLKRHFEYIHTRMSAFAQQAT